MIGLFYLFKNKLIHGRNLRKLHRDLTASVQLLDSYKRPVILEVSGLRGDLKRHEYMNSIVCSLADSGKQQCRILEIGSFVGNSLLTWDNAIQEHFNGRGSIVAIDPMTPFTDGTGKASEMDYLFGGDFAYRILMHNIKFFKTPIQHIRGKSEDILPLLAQAFDIVWVDGDHSYTHVLTDILEGMKLIKPGGVLCGDDLELQSHEVENKTMMESGALDYIIDPRTGKFYHPGVTRAVGEALGVVDVVNGVWSVSIKGAEEKG